MGVSRYKIFGGPVFGRTGHLDPSHSQVEKMSIDRNRAHSVHFRKKPAGTEVIALPHNAVGAAFFRRGRMLASPQR
jgi:hypothetical protein